jgi:hypothetical protein
VPGQTMRLGAVIAGAAAFLAAGLALGRATRPRPAA